MNTGVVSIILRSILWNHALASIGVSTQPTTISVYYDASGTSKSLVLKASYPSVISHEVRIRSRLGELSSSRTKDPNPPLH